MLDICRSEEKCQELMLQVRSAPREEEVERFEIIIIIVIIMFVSHCVTAAFAEHD